jgi:uncharacterized protein (TIRG00374 family)
LSYYLANSGFNRYCSQKQVFLRQTALMPKGKVERRKYVFLFLRIAVVTAGIVWVVSQIGREQNWDSFVEHFRRMNMWILAGTLCLFTLGHVIVGFRWWLLLRSQSIFIGFWVALKLFLLGWFYNNCMPGSVGGDLVRAWYVTRHTDKKFEAALSVFVDRLIGLLTTLMIAVFFYWLFLRGRGLVKDTDEHDGFLKSVAEYKWIFLWVGVVIGVVFCGLLLYRGGRAILRKVWSYIRVQGLEVIEKLKNAILIYRRRPLTILAVFGLTVFVQIMVITGFWFLGINMGIKASIKYYYVFFTLTWVVGAVPVSIGGAGVVEFSLVNLFTRFAGVEKPAALAIALCQRAVWVLTSLPGAVIHLIGAHLPKHFFIDYEKSID